VARHVLPGSQWSWWGEFAAVLVLVLGLNLLVWANFVGGWALAGIAVLKL
jgi:hypothetical protein